MDWFRWHQGTVNDPKWRVVARRAGLPVHAVVAVWAAVLENANESPERGTLDRFDAEDVGAALDLDASQVQAVVDAMQGKVLNGAHLTGWERRQPKREDPSTERVRRHRERRKPESPEGVKRSETQCNAPEESRGEEKREEKTDPPGVALAREPVDPEPQDQDEEPLPEVPTDRGAKVVPLRPAAAPDALPFGGLDWEGRTSGAVVLREWIRLQPAPPSRSDRDRFGATCKRIADEHTTGEIALAFLGIGALWPHAPPKSEPWTPEHLRKRFVEALAAAAKHPVLARMREDAAFDEAFDRFTSGGRR